VTLGRLQAAVADPATPLWLRMGLQAWLRCGGAVRLESVLRLPRSPAELRRAQRDAWLVLLAEHFEGSLSQRAAAVHRYAWNEAWRWQHWRCTHGGPPEHATPRAVAAFYAWRFGLPRSTRQVQNILARNSAPGLFPVPGGTVKLGLLELEDAANGTQPER